MSTDLAEFITLSRQPDDNDDKRKADTIVIVSSDRTRTGKSLALTNPQQVGRPEALPSRRPATTLFFS